MQELSRAEIDELLREQFVARIGCRDGDDVYVVPIIYAYDGEAFYVASVEGRKVELMRAHPRVCFEVDRYEAGNWRSAIAYGRYEELRDADAEAALDLLAARFQRERTRTAGPSTVCFRIVLDEVTGRAVTRG
jgi:nitroimidazol reductase NimA-like FMN-containing flavoprotein (pyridoxamine 5'-phosphate oxidase superfamily)